MEEDFKSRGDVCWHLLDLIPKGREWMPIVGDEEGLKASEEKDLELRLGLPGGSERGGRRREDRKAEDSSVLSLSLFSKDPKPTTISSSLSVGAKRGFFDTVEPEEDLGQKQGGSVELHGRADLGKELSQKASGANGKSEQQQSLERKASHACAAGNNSSSQTRVTVVGWPPIRSFRKNLASTSFKQSVESPNGQLESRETKPENFKKGLFVKINMDGVPIGRKVDLKAYDSYEKLSEAVEGLFKGLLAAQKDPSCNDAQKNEDEEVFSGILDGTGEYILVYEDSEGDRMLVGDDPWEMFISTAKRLRVLKTSDLPNLHADMQLGATEGRGHRRH